MKLEISLMDSICVCFIHFHIYIYICVCVCVCVCFPGDRRGGYKVVK
jgi:hypothetical protein